MNQYRVLFENYIKVHYMVFVSQYLHVSQDRDLIPKGSLCEVGFAELDADPIATVSTLHVHVLCASLCVPLPLCICFSHMCVYVFVCLSVRLSICLSPHERCS